ncbi:MAG: GNAT family N-acetyltransferase [Halioglobus sp.]
MTEIELQPTLIGNTITLRPLLPEDFPGLYEAAADPLIWELHPDSSRYKQDIFEERFFLGAIASGGAFAAIDNESGTIIGSSRFYKWKPDQQEISIGYTFLQRDRWGNGTNQEMKALMLNHIFTFAHTVWFHVGEVNLRSRKAVEKLGAVLSHTEDRELEGLAYVQMYYKLNDADYRDNVKHG